MNTFSEFDSNIQTLSAILKDYHYIHTSNQLETAELETLKKQSCALLTENTSLLLSSHEQGFLRDDLYFPVRGKTIEELRSVFGKCRYILGSYEELDLLNQVAGELNKPGYLESIALFIHFNKDIDSPISFDGSAVSLLSKKMKSMNALAVRGVFFISDFSDFKEAAVTVKTIYEQVKIITTILPCRISFFNLGSCIELFTKASEESSENAHSLIQSANLVSFLNTTSFYSRLLIS